MTTKTLKTKIINKHDTETNWAKSSYIPNKAEIIVFDADETYNYERFKIGDGVHNVNELNFADKHLLDKIDSMKHIPEGGSIGDFLVCTGNGVVGWGAGATGTLPVGSLILWDGDTIPAGWELAEEVASD